MFRSVLGFAIALALALVLLATQLPVSQAVDPIDILHEFYNSLDGPNWRNNSGWSDPSNRDVCTWAGVTCAGRDQVIRLDLQRNGLAGQLPQSLGQLQWLRRLDLSHNRLIGPIPDSIGDISGMNYIFLTDNNLSGNIPKSMGKLRNLQALYLDLNNLDGPLPSEFGNLNSLQYLTVEMNHLTGSVPSSLTNCPLMLALFSYNSFTGTFPSGLCRVLTCGAYANPNLQCPTQDCSKCNIQSCNCGNVCMSSSDCNGLCKSCTGSMIKYCR